MAGFITSPIVIIVSRTFLFGRRSLTNYIAAARISCFNQQPGEYGDYQQVRIIIVICEIVQSKIWLFASSCTFLTIFVALAIPVNTMLFA